jgi:ribonuclease HII
MLPICSDGSDMEDVLGKLAGGLDLSMESALLEKHDGAVAIGVDEAGRGPLCGPVVAAAVTVLPEAAAHGAGQVPVLGVTDSKLLSEAEREALACSLMRHPRVRWA